MSGRGRSGNSSALNHCVHCGFHAGWCFAVGPRSMGKLRFVFSVAEGRRCSACSTYVQGSPCSQGVFTRKTDARTSDLYSLLGACMYRTRYQVLCRLVYAFLFFLFSASGGWVKIKLELPHLLPRMYQIHVVFRFNPRSRCNSSSRCWYRAREHVDPA